MTLDELNFPDELCCKPIPTIGFIGLDGANNRAHRVIENAFCKNTNLLPLSFKVLPANHTFPTTKTKVGKSDEEPKGILKIQWMKKHLYDIPAVVAVLSDLNDWDEVQWETKEAQCIQHLQAVRNKLDGLGTKLALILIQKASVGDESRFGERMAMLRNNCATLGVQLFVVPHDDHLQGNVVRIQLQLRELAKAYYTHEIIRNQTSKVSHRYLLVRLNFKMAYLSEMKDDDTSARRFYAIAYTELKKIPKTETNLHELKIVNGFINYKLCSLHFRSDEPRQALSQLRSHMQQYKISDVTKPLLFEHYAWLAAQYAAFADLFDEAIRQGLSAVQTEHPGIYYKKAALYSIERKLIAKQVCQNVVVPTDLIMYPIEFWGQRSWRSGQMSSKLDLQAELAGIAVLQAKEKTVDHSAIIIEYLGKGISQFKTYRCPRMRLQLLVQMAEEYHAARDHGNALTILSHMIWDYRNEKWWQLLAALLQLGLSSAYLSASLHDYVTFAVEALGPQIPINDELKMTIYNNLNAILKGTKPEPHPGGTPSEVSIAEREWFASFSNKNHIVADMSKIEACFAVRYSFASSSFQKQESIHLKIYIKSFCPGPVQFSSISATLVGDSQVSELTASEQNVFLDPGVIGVFNCSGPVAIDAGKQVTACVVTVAMATGNGRQISIKLRPYAPATVLPPEFQIYKPPSTEIEWGPLEPLLVTKIAAPQANVELNIEHSGPALLGEQYPINFKIINRDTVALHHCTLEVKLLTPGDETSPDASTRLSDEQQTSISPKSIKVQLESILAGETKKPRIFLKGYSNGDRSLAINFVYSLNEEDNIPNRVYSICEKQTTVSVVQPLEVTTRLLTLKFEPTFDCYAHETFLLCTDVKAISPCPITIKHSSLELGLYVANEGDKQSSQLAGVTLYPNDTGTDIFPLIFTETRPQSVAVGTYVLQWSREGSDITTSSSITLPAVKCLPSLLSVSMDLPAHGRVHAPMDVEYKLFNRTSTLLQFDMRVDPSDAFVFSGLKQTVLRLLPESEKTLKYKMLPLLSGLLALPRLVLSPPEGSEHDAIEQLTILLERNLPSHVYVMPQEKNRQELTPAT